MKEILSHKNHHYHILGLVFFVALVSVAFAVDYTSLTGMDVATVGDPVQAGEATVGCSSKSSQVFSSYGNGMNLIDPVRAPDELRTKLFSNCKNACSADCESEIKNINYEETYLSRNYESVKNPSPGFIGIIRMDATADCICKNKPKETECDILKKEIQDVNEIIRTRMGDVGGYSGHSQNRNLAPIDEFTIETYKKLLENLQEEYQRKCGSKETGMLPREDVSPRYGSNPELFEPTGNPPPDKVIIDFPTSEKLYGPKEGKSAPIITEGEPVEEMAKEFEKQQKQENIIQKTWKWIKGLFGAGGVALPEDFNDLPEPMKARIKEFFKNKETGSLIKYDVRKDFASQYIGDGNKVLVALSNFPQAKCANNCELQITTSEGKTINIKANINSDNGLIEIDPKDLTRIPQTTGKIEVVQQPKDSKFEITSISLVRIGGEPDEDMTNVRLYDDSKLSWSDTEDKPTDTLISSVDNIAKYKFTAFGEEVKLSFVNQGGKPYPYPPLPPRIKEIPTGITVNFPIGQVNLPPSVAVKENLADIPVFNLKISDPEQITQIKIAGKEIDKEYIKKTIRVCIGQEISDDLSITEPASDTLAAVPPDYHGRATSVYNPLDYPNLPRAKPEEKPKDGIIASGHYNTVSLAEDYPTRPPRATEPSKGTEALATHNARISVNVPPREVPPHWQWTKTNDQNSNLLTASAVRLTGKATSESVACESIKQQISDGKLALGTAIAQLEKIQQKLNELNKKGQGNSEEARKLINQKNDLQSKLPRLQEEIRKLEQQYAKECREVKEKTTIVKIPCDVVIPEKDKDKIKDIVITREEDTTPKTPCEQKRCDPNRSYLTPEQDPCKGCYSCNPNTNTCAPSSSTLTTDKKLCSKNSVPSCQGKTEGEICTTEFHTSQCEMANIMIKGGGETSGCICPAPDDIEYELVCPPNQMLIDLGAPGKQCVCKDENYYAKGLDCLSKQKYCDAYLPGSIWATGSHGSLYCKCPPGQEIINNECRGRPETGQRQTIIDTPPKTAPTQPPATIGTPGQQTTTQPTSTTTSTQPPKQTTSTQTTSTTTANPPTQQTTTPPPSISSSDQDDGMELCPPAQMCPADYYANVLMGCYESYAGVSEVCRQSIGLCSQVCNKKEQNKCDQFPQPSQSNCRLYQCAVYIQLGYDKNSVDCSDWSQSASNLLNSYINNNLGFFDNSEDGLLSCIERKCGTVTQ